MSPALSSTGFDAVVATRTRALGACPLCGSRSLRDLFSIPDRLVSVPGNYRYRSCHSCGTVFQDPVVETEQLRMCYPDDYYRVWDSGLADRADPSGRRMAAGLRATLRRVIAATVRQEKQGRIRELVGGALGRFDRLRERAFWGLPVELLPPSPAPGRALEVGCGRGDLLMLLGRAGWRAEGLEWDPGMAGEAARRTGLPVRVGDFHAQSFDGESYQLVTLHHVIEHLPDIRDAMARLAALIAPGGRLVLFLPNTASLGARLFREDWFQWDAPRHLVLPSSRGLDACARGCGLDPISVRTMVAPQAVHVLAASRAYRRRRSIPSVSVGFGDRLLAGIEAILVASGFHWGENLVATFRKRPAVNQ